MCSVAVEWGEKWGGEGGSLKCKETRVGVSRERKEREWRRSGQEERGETAGTGTGGKEGTGETRGEEGTIQGES